MPRWERRDEVGMMGYFNIKYMLTRQVKYKKSQTNSFGKEKYYV